MKRTLNREYQFRRVFRTGSRFRGNTFRAVFRVNTLGFIRLGFSLSAKRGNAVSRNLMKRRIRALASKQDLGADVVIMPVGRLDGLRWEGVRDDFLELMEKIGNSVEEDRT
ncbi:MAG: hypothetical protein AVO35_01540 [Candidatus Aegiribacteria sp. MLS_C]|nr:MAG: hypothetical protein AVO35_01540 [Candidatus Aegiribacteria sp. MLS_C]